MAEGAVTFHVASGEAFVPRLFAELGVAITSVTVSRPTLDDVFMRYTGSTIRDAEASPGGERTRHAGVLEGGRMTAAFADVVAVRVPERSWRSEGRAVRAVWWREMIRFANDRVRIVTALIQPLLFLFVLGSRAAVAVARRPRTAWTSPRSCSLGSSAWRCGSAA